MVMGRWAVVIQGQERIAVVQAPLNDFFYGVHAERFDIVLKHHGNIMLLDPRNDVFRHLVGIGSFPCVTAGDVPVEFLANKANAVFAR